MIPESSPDWSKAHKCTCVSLEGARFILELQFVGQGFRPEGRPRHWNSTRMMALSFGSLLANDLAYYLIYGSHCRYDLDICLFFPIKDQLPRVSKSEVLRSIVEIDSRYQDSLQEYFSQCFKVINYVNRISFKSKMMLAVDSLLCICE